MTTRCCGRCDGVNDICIADQLCEVHKVEGCRICWPEPIPYKIALNKQFEFDDVQTMMEETLKVSAKELFKKREDVIRNAYSGAGVLDCLIRGLAGDISAVTIRIDQIGDECWFAHTADMPDGFIVISFRRTETMIETDIEHNVVLLRVETKFVTYNQI